MVISGYSRTFLGYKGDNMKFINIKSVFTKSLLIFLIAITPIYFSGVLINIWGQNDIKEERIGSLKSNINFSLNVLEREIENVITLEANLFNNDELNYLIRNHSSDSIYTIAQKINSLKGKLSEIKGMSNYIDLISIYIPKIDKVISNEEVSNLAIEEYNLVNQLTFYKKGLIKTYDKDIFINISSNFGNMSGENEEDSNFIISVKINKAEIKDFLEKTYTVENEHSILFSDDYQINLQEDIKPELKDEFNGFLNEGKFKDDNITLQDIKFNNNKYIVGIKYSKILNGALISYVPTKNLFNILFRYYWWLVIISILTLIIILLFSLVIQKLIAIPIRKLITGFKHLEKGDFSIELRYHSQDEFNYIIKKFNKMVARLKKSLEKVYEEEIHARNAELKQLQYQINPHFLYNSIFIIYRMAKLGDIDTVIKFSKHLGHYYRFINRGVGDQVSLHEEVEHSKNYTSILNIRLSDRITIDFDSLPESFKDKKVPRLILQPLIENAFEHGLKDKVNEGIINISINTRQNRLIIIVEDNGDIEDNTIVDLSAKLEEKNIFENSQRISAILNINRRLQIKFGNESGLYLSRSELGGLAVKMILDF